MITNKIDEDLKTAMLSGDKPKVSTLRGIKSSLQYAQVGRDTLSEAELIAVLQKEAKKRQEAADLYKKAGNTEQERKELLEKSVIEGYLPKQLSEDELNSIIDEVVAEIDGLDKSNMGQVIGKVKSKTAGAADGSTIARIIQSRIKD